MKLTNEQIVLLKSLRDGADISDYREGLLCRELEKLGLVCIGKRMGDYHGAEQLPYFGAILTTEGRKRLKEES